MKFALPEAAALRKPKRASQCRLAAAGWNDLARRSLERLIERGAGKGLPAVFDFDNTIISGDIGEAVLAILSAEGRVTPAGVCATLCPPVRVAGTRPLAIGQCSDAMQYYEALLAPTVHGDADPTPLANGYVWATQALEGLTLAEVTTATAKAFHLGQGRESRYVEPTPGGAKYPAPRFHGQMVELIARLLKFNYELWIVSASNVWSVRWMVTNGLNPLLRELGVREGIKPECVIGLATLLTDERGGFYKDSVLVRQSPAYAGLAGRRTKSLRITRHLQFPAPVYSGKVACILDAIGTNPYFCAGDSPSDHAMMCLSRHRLWIARRDKPQSQQATRKLIRRFGSAGWILQECFDSQHFGASVGTLHA